MKIYLHRYWRQHLRISSYIDINFHLIAFIVHQSKLYIYYYLIHNKFYIMDDIIDMMRSFHCQNNHFHKYMYMDYFLQVFFCCLDHIIDKMIKTSTSTLSMNNDTERIKNSFHHHSNHLNKGIDFQLKTWKNLWNNLYTYWFEY